MRKTSPLKLLTINDVSHVRTTKRTTANLLPAMGFKTKMMEMSLIRRITQVCNFIRSYDFMPPDRKNDPISV